MKIDAKVRFNDTLANELDRDTVSVPVDIDYVEGNRESVVEWVRQELEEMFGRSFCDEDFEILNIDEIVEDITFDEFQSKVC